MSSLLQREPHTSSLKHRLQYLTPWSFDLELEARDLVVWVYTGQLWRTAADYCHGVFCWEHTVTQLL